MRSPSCCRIFSLSIMIVPSNRAPRMVSCMRFRVRMKVDFPQPDGPINAVILFFAKSRLMSCRAWNDP